MAYSESKAQQKYESAMDLGAIIDEVTSGASKPYFNKCLRNLSCTNPANARTICDYIIAEQTEINIKIRSEAQTWAMNQEAALRVNHKVVTLVVLKAQVDLNRIHKAVLNADPKA